MYGWRTVMAEHHLCHRRKDTLTIRQTLDNLRLDLSADDDEDDDSQLLQQQATKVWTVTLCLYRQKKGTFAKPAFPSFHSRAIVWK